MDFLTTALSFLVALAILITVHEFGHFWVARRLGVQILRFSIGFGRGLVRWSGRDGTEYVLAAIPLGGYVKMLDEREGPVPPAARSRAFNRQPVWKRAAIIVAGPIGNLLLAVLLYWGVLMAGDPGIRPRIGDVAPDSIAERAGLVAGDEILAVGDRKTPTWDAVFFALLVNTLDGADLPLRVRDPEGRERFCVLDGVALTHLPEDGDLFSSLGLSLARPRIPPVIGEIVPDSPAERAGLQPGDRILQSDGVPITRWRDWVDRVRAHPDQPMHLVIERQGVERELTIVPRSIKEEGERIGRIGAAVAVPEDLFQDYRVVVKLGPGEALGAAIQKTWDLSALTLRMIGRVLTGRASIEKNLGGPITIAETAGKTASIGLAPFIKFLAVISISLGVLNLLPIPVLDGGHLLFLGIEALRGRPLSEQTLARAQHVGLFLIGTLMILAFYADFLRLLD